MLDNLDRVPILHPLVFHPVPSRFFPGDSWDRETEALISYCGRRPDLAECDVVLAHFLVPDGYHALGLGRALGKPVAAMAWGDDVHAWPAAWPYWRDRLRAVLAGADLLIACSARMAQDANEWLDTPREDWQIIYGGVDSTEFYPAGSRTGSRATVLPASPRLLDPERRILLTLASPVAAKGYGELLDAWRVVERDAPTWDLVMGGANGDLDMAAEIERRGLTDRAFWIGPQPSAQVSALMRASDGFVLPSHNEGLSLSVLEALATGLPTIATDVGGHSEVIRAADEGWLIPPRDVDALVSALRELTARERGPAGAARAAAERVGSPEQNARRLQTALKSLAASHAR